MSNGHILIAGDIPVDLLVYPSPNLDPSQRGEQKSGAHRCNGGATLIADLLYASGKEHNHRVHEPALEVLQDKSLGQSFSAITELEKFGEALKPPFSFKVKRRQPLVTRPVWYPPRTLPKPSENVSVLVFQDAESNYSSPQDGVEFGFNKPKDAVEVVSNKLNDGLESGFSNSCDAVDFFKKSHPGTLIYHMARPLGTGVIWDAVRRGPYTTDGSTQDPEKLIVVVSADDLRAEGIELYHGLSWENTCEDFVEKLGSNGKLDTLVTCANLIVLFGCDGIIYHRGLKMEPPVLFFDPLGVEGRFIRQNIGPIPGIAEAFIGGLATKIAQSPPRSPLSEGIKHGFITARRLAKLGFKNRELHEWPRYPFQDIMEKEPLPAEAPITLEIPSENISRGNKRYWSILHHNIGDPVQVACNIVKKGTSSAANWIPIASFGKLTILDRSEIEGFRTMFNSIHEYLSAPQTKPLNIAIFGSRGSGKSFAAGQVAGAAATASSRKIQHLRFNLSQITSLEDLSIALNKVRDCNLSGALPLVYINGFDTEFSGHPLGWLAHLLPPMHGGHFLDRGQIQHTGPAIILLASSFTTSLENFQEFSASQGNDKGILRAQEFLSGLHGFVDVIGLDQIDPSDALYPVRRAVVLRALLEAREPKLKIGEGISIDQSVLDGLLMIPTYRHGLRSLKSIIEMSKVTGKRHFERAALPPAAQLGLHFDYQTFVEYSRYNMISDEFRETVSEGLHKVYIGIKKDMAEPNEEKDPAVEPWPLLGEEYKESTRAHVEDIPRKLRMIFCFLAEEDDREAVDNFSDKELDFLAEVEHERWNAERLQNQWHTGPRNEKQRTTPFLKPWRDLEKKWQRVDREMVKSYPTILPDNYKIYRVGKVTKTKLKRMTPTARTWG